MPKDPNLTHTLSIFLEQGNHFIKTMREMHHILTTGAIAPPLSVDEINLTAYNLLTGYWLQLTQLESFVNKNIYSGTESIEQYHAMKQQIAAWKQETWEKFGLEQEPFRAALRQTFENIVKMNLELANLQQKKEHSEPPFSENDLNHYNLIDAERKILILTNALSCAQEKYDTGTQLFNKLLQQNISLANANTVIAFPAPQQATSPASKEEEQGSSTQPPSQP